MDFQTPDSDAAKVGEDFQTPDADAAKIQSPLESGARGALRNFPLAQQAAAAIAPINPFSEKPTYSAELQHLTEAAEQGKAQNPKSYYTGAGAGALAPALLPVIGEGLEAAGPIAAGAIQGAGQATSDTSVTQKPLQAAKEAAIGGGLGAGIGAISQYVGKQLPTASERIAANTEQTLAIPARRMANVLGKDIQSGLGDIDTTMQSTVLPDGRPLLEMSDSAMRRASKVEDAVDMYGKRIGDTVKQVKTDVPANPLMDDISKMAIGRGGLKVQNDALDKINEIIIKNADKEGNISFDQLRNLKDEVYNEMVHVDPATGNLLPGSRKAMEAWGYLKDLQDKIVAQEKPDLFPGFVEANNHYGNLVGLQKGLSAVGLKDAAKQATIGSGLNPLTLLSKIGKGAAKLVGADKFANNLPMAMNPIIRKASEVGPKLIPTGAKNIPQAELTDYLTSKYGKQQ